METIEQQQEEQATPHFADHKKGGLGAVIGIIVIIVLLALGGIYYFTQGVSQIPQYNAQEDAAVMQMKTQSDSNALADIEADVNATDLSEIDALLEDLDAEASAGTN